MLAERHIEGIETMPTPEVWLRGPVPDVPPLLQPVAHSLLQSREEAEPILLQLDVESLWTRPGGAASAGYHAMHAAGSLDRLFTYARGASLSSEQREALAAESRPQTIEGAQLLERLAAAIDRALQQLRTTPEHTLTERREVGRARLPSTVLGLLFHAAEHTQRHMGQLATTAKVVRSAGTQEGA